MMLALWRLGYKQGEVTYCNAGDLCGIAAMWLLIDRLRCYSAPRAVQHTL
jgi:hypothetical protein